MPDLTPHDLATRSWAEALCRRIITGPPSEQSGFGEWDKRRREDEFDEEAMAQEGQSQTRKERAA